MSNWQRQSSYTINNTTQDSIIINTRTSGPSDTENRIYSPVTDQLWWNGNQILIAGAAGGETLQEVGANSTSTAESTYTMAAASGLVAGVIFRNDSGDELIRISNSPTIAPSPVNAPILSLSGNTNTGLYHPVDNAIGFSCAGIERVRFTSGTTAAQPTICMSGATPDTDTGFFHDADNVIGVACGGNGVFKIDEDCNADFTSSTKLKPAISIVSSSTDIFGGSLTLKNTKGGDAGAVGDRSGSINFVGPNDAIELINYASIFGDNISPTAGSETGILSMMAHSLTGKASQNLTTITPDPPSDPFTADMVGNIMFLGSSKRHIVDFIPGVPNKLTCSPSSGATGPLDFIMYFSHGLNVTSSGVGIGTDEPATSLHVLDTTTNVNTIANVLRIEHQTADSPGDGFGVGIEFASHTSGSGVAKNVEVGHSIVSQLTDNTPFGEDFDLIISGMESGDPVQEMVRVAGTNSSAAVASGLGGGVIVGNTSNICGIRRISAVVTNSWEDGYFGNSSQMILLGGDFTNSNIASRSPELFANFETASGAAGLIMGAAAGGSGNSIIAVKLIPKGFRIAASAVTVCVAETDAIVWANTATIQLFTQDIATPTAANTSLGGAVTLAAWSGTGLNTQYTPVVSPVGTGTLALVVKIIISSGVIMNSAEALIGAIVNIERQ